MHFIFLLFAFVAAIAAAFTLPKDAADGFYVAYYNETGHEVHLKDPDMSSLDALVTSSPVTPQIRGTTPLVLPRDGQTWCGCKYRMNSGNCDGAVQGLKNQMGKQRLGRAFINPGMAWYEIRRFSSARPVVAFLCRTRDAGVGDIDIYTYTQKLQEITGSCGFYVPGTKALGALRVGYMIYNEGDDFCRSATGSTQNRC
ncbi:hypothetical protein CGCF415_v004677 [Colletotrichum fructicola]|uniref:Secreted protein n=1 Tax=Colletotrichum fructicola (strain Nara gc5) TaxID=1213859 RepID=L2G511_COLFN|nr:uncharacterized protein CGMCC3_g9597 [Colletotrichum fructicola]KAF4474394.1 hypothetical protein CGGC5_v016677 [Colletotrichum fructicola Nara gc5]KAE9574466.1 hypothetical protein CGMCC3_g9597 [Colletotrichum fructicola]KAF4431757.1 hypothetical protein CFRS1_v011226 [Colletotrichum fructicola]KAF4898765.1 hypothetical protein CGCFRS4_v004135 [Colletotrichum fructicola]KAF4911123.1 hypothetical protein CGCF415_v004677 [Colletotrichum fructicola]